MNIERTDIDAVLDRMESVEGWFTREEGDLLFKTAIKTVEQHPRNAIVEVGSYLGRSTLVLGNAVKMASKDSPKIYAIDPHEGDLSYPGGPGKVNPTKQKFIETMATSGLSDVVELIAKKSYEVTWDKEIGFIFIDALHDYANVSRDFNHFEKWIGGRIAFHDYCPGWPGVQRCVDEILVEKKYIKEDQVGSLVILEKVMPR